jgi:gliding motility-associated-like protein
LKLVCVNQAGCIDADSINFVLLNNQVELIIPNVFSPDADGYNDLFNFKTNGINSLKGSIYNRWGTLVYEWEGLSAYWDGKIKGKAATEGVYFYIVSAKDILNAQTEKHGTVTLIRKH